MPKGGIHTPYIKTKRGSLTLHYKVLAKKGVNSLKIPRWSATFLSLKWNHLRGVFRPSKNFASVLTSLTPNESELLSTGSIK
jgi:hypothetical protein